MALPTITDARSSWFATRTIAPGIVDTELNNGLRNGVPAIRKLISPEESAAGLVNLIANLSKENQQRFQNYNGETFEW